jgi:transcriptional regulator with XRE-family HTH domain
MPIGRKLRQLRESRDLNIKQLAELATCSSSLISQLERGKADPSISTLKKIAKALNVNIVDFFTFVHEDNDVVTRQAERVDMQLKKWDARIQSLIKNIGNKRMQPFYTVIKPGGGSKGMYSHEGEEFGIVLKGEMDLVLKDKTYKVRANDSFYFSSQTPHNWNNKGKEDVVVVWVITPPTF